MKFFMYELILAFYSQDNDQASVNKEKKRICSPAQLSFPKYYKAKQTWWRFNVGSIVELLCWVLAIKVLTLLKICLFS